MDKVVRLYHGSGGKQMQKLLQDIFFRHFGNRILDAQTDSAILNIPTNQVAFTTDGFVVDPIFFPGGNIGTLAVCGTVNDLAVSGATPLYLSASFIIEEGFPLEDLERIVLSMAAELRRAHVKIVTGDTKVVNKGKCDKIFITTAGVGKLEKRNQHISHAAKVKPGDKVIINGTIGDHGMTVMNARESFSFQSTLETDCAPLNGMIRKVLDATNGVTFMRDATRGGVASVLCELATKTGLGITVDEASVPVKPAVRGMCELLGFDPLYVANEGKVVMVVKPSAADKVLEVLKSCNTGRSSSIIGEVTTLYPEKVVLKTISGGRRFVDLLSGDQLPRIC
jgi:hydrogenase expression/formation protein HypE